MAIVASITFTIGAMAQEQNAQDGQQRPQFSQEQMTQRRTDAMVKQYGLNEEQAKQLLELNTKYAGKMGPRQGFGRHPGQRSERGGQRAGGPDRAAADSARSRRPQRVGGVPGGRGQIGEEMRKSMEAYDEELKGILSEEQFKAYKENQKNRRQRFGRGNGQRRQSND